MQKLVEKYAPRRLADLVGQGHVTRALSRWVSSPYPIAFLFHGASGTGKTSAGLCLAAELRVGVNEQEYGGFHQLASGDQTADSVRRLAKLLRNIPMFGSGWKCVLVNECDVMSPQAEAVWLDVLENLPPSTVIVFTTNNPGRLSERFSDRCTALEFRSSADDLRQVATELMLNVWQAEGLAGTPEEILGKPGIVRDGKVSFRRAVEAVERALLLAEPAKPGELY